MTELSGSKRLRSPDDEEFNDDPPLKKRRTSSVIGDIGEEPGPSVPYEEYVARNILRSLDDDSISDVTFVVENEHFCGIRALFATQSAVFRRMLYGGMAESDPSNHVILNDISISAFKYLRSTFYNVFRHEQAANLQCDMVIDVLFAAHQYMIEPLVLKCIDFIKRIQNMNDWYLVLRQLERSHCPRQANLFLSHILNEGAFPYILQYKSVRFLQNDAFSFLHRNTVVVIISSDYLSVKEHEIWDSLIKWSKQNAGHNRNHNQHHDREQKDEERNSNSSSSSSNANESGDNASREEDEHKNCDADEDGDAIDNELDRTLAPDERALIATFIKHVRFKRMDAAYFKRHIVDNQILSEPQVIQVMFSREDGTKWSSEFNDRDRQKCKQLDTFDLNEVCLTLPQIQALSVGDFVDFRDIYGLFCAATVIATDHSLHRVKIRYNEWGTRYDEWYMYKKQGSRRRRSRANHGGGDDDEDADAAHAEDDDDEEEDEDDDDDDNNDDDDDVAGYSDDGVALGWPASVRLSQRDMCSRFARAGSISKRNIKRKGLKEQIAGLRRNDERVNNKIQVKPSMLFWKVLDDRRGIATEINIEEYRHKWLNARFVEYERNSLKYSHHIKVEVEITGRVSRWWIHPDSEQEIRTIQATD